MTIKISPLNLLLDEQNPRFLTIEQRTQTAIRKYMAMYEDVCQLARDINDNEGLILGERIVIIEENGKYVVMEGNRRACALQFMLKRDLIPDGFEHKIKNASKRTLANIEELEVDIAPDRDYAILLMAKRHISGVKHWKPLAKKQFFSNMYDSGNSISKLNEMTGVSVNSIRKHIRDYKFLLKASNEYKKNHPQFEEDFLSYHINSFLRIFSAKQEIGFGNKVAPVDILKIRHDNRQNTISDLPKDIFRKIVQLVFEATIVKETVDTRDTLFSVNGVKSLIDSITDKDKGNSSSKGNSTASRNQETFDGEKADKNGEGNETTEHNKDGNASGYKGDYGTHHKGNPNTESKSDGQGDANSREGKQKTGGPTGGGSDPSTFFEYISWENKLFPSNNDHAALIVALDELHRMSRNKTKVDRRSVKTYCAYPVAAGMLLRSAYEQSLILQLKKTGQWESLKKTYTFPMLSNIEDKVKNNKGQVLPDRSMRRAFNQIVSAKSREFLNANVHNPWLIRATSDTLEGMANGGMRSLIQMIIDYQ